MNKAIVLCCASFRLGIVSNFLVLAAQADHLSDQPQSEQLVLGEAGCGFVLSASIYPALFLSGPRDGKRLDSAKG